MSSLPKLQWLCNYRTANIYYVKKVNKYIAEFCMMAVTAEGKPSVNIVYHDTFEAAKAAVDKIVVTIVEKEE
jgi:hypothetical protein